MSGDSGLAQHGMDKAFADRAARIFLREARERLDSAVGVARAADICAELGKMEEAVSLSLDIEPLLYEVRNLVNTASMIIRMTKD